VPCRAPAPISFGQAGYVHPAFASEIQNVLQWRDRKSGSGRPSQADQLRSRIANVASATPHRVPKTLPIALGQILDPIADKLLLVTSFITLSMPSIMAPEALVHTDAVQGFQWLDVPEVTGRSLAAIVFYRAYLLAADLAPIEALAGQHREARRLADDGNQRKIGAGAEHFSGAQADETAGPDDGNAKFGRGVHDAGASQGCGRAWRFA